jgi:hypothetical protein
MNLFETVNGEARAWMRDVMSEGKIADAESSMVMLGAGLRAIRERLTFAEAAQFGDQLPLLVRGMFFQGWTPAAHSAQTRRELLAMVRERCCASAGEPLPDPAAVLLRVIEHRMKNAERATIGDFRFEAAVKANDGLGHLWPVVPANSQTPDCARIGAV